MTHAHYAESVSITPGERPGEVVVSFVRSDGRVVRGADALIFRGESVAYLEAATLVAAGKVRSVGEKPSEEK